VLFQDFDGASCGVEASAENSSASENNSASLESIFDELFQGIDIDSDQFCNEIIEEEIARSAQKDAHATSYPALAYSNVDHDHLYEKSVHEYCEKEEAQVAADRFDRGYHRSSSSELSPIPYTEVLIYDDDSQMVPEHFLDVYEEDSQDDFYIECDDPMIFGELIPADDPETMEFDQQYLKPRQNVCTSSIF